MRGQALLFTIGVIAAVLFFGPCAWARAPEDGFVAARKMTGRYFTVELAAGVEELFLVQSLNISAGDRVLAGENPGGAAFSLSSLADLVDALFLWSSNVLDMRLLSYHGTIKVVRAPADLDAIYRRLYGAEPPGDKAYYAYDVNTVYVLAGNFTKEIVGHEVAHAIISNYFVVQPSMKVQEVLAGYIEYQLTKPSRP